MQLDFQSREVTVKLVYYGAALSGKTTNLVALHAAADEAARGKLITLDTRDDRTLFFDLLPLTFRGAGGLSLRLKVFTVPGQVIHASTRRLLLQGADGVALIADSRVSETQANAAAFLDLRKNLGANGLELSRMPLVIQFNKRDLPDVRSEAEIAALAARGREPVFQAIATQGTGVVETFVGLLWLTWRSLDAQHGLSSKLGVDGLELLHGAARQLRARASPQELLRRSVGGSFEPPPSVRGVP